MWPAKYRNLPIFDPIWPSMRFSLASLLLAAFSLSAAQADELSCQSEHRFGQEGALQMSVKLRRSATGITALTMESTTVVYSTKTGYSCSAAFDQSTPNARWSTSGATTTVLVATDDAGEKSALSIRRTGKGYLINPQGLSSDTCGARGQWPASVLVPLRGSRCTTLY